MNPERWGRIKQIYHTALELEPGRREVYLKEACAQDEGLLKEVASLLAQEGDSEGLFESPALDAVAQALARDQAQKPRENLIGQTLPHYRIEKKIGEGGMGEVFLAQDTSLNRKVALKFLPPEMQQDPVAHKRFLREARSAAALDNPYICSIHEVGEFEGKDFIVMEYVDGETLAEKLRRGRLPLNQALQIAAEVAEALQAAHGKGIIHRDLKPSNIMLMKTGHAKVMDFGLAKQIILSGGIESQEESVSTITRSGTTLGTLAYMSPEQVRGEAVDARSDIFSFGLVLYEMLTRTHPFRKESPMETASAILQEEPRPVEGIPAALEELISRCLRKDLERRFQHIGDVRIALLELKEGLDSGRLQRAPAASRQARPVVLPVEIAITVVVLVAAGWYWLSRQSPAEPEPLISEPLTSYPGYENTPSFSPDGNFVAFEWCGETGANCDVWIKQVGVEPTARLTSDPAVDFSPAWSPNGLFIAFLRQLSPAKWAVMIVPRSGGQERELGRSDAATFDLPYAMSFLAWTPDSKWLVIPSAESSDDGLSLLSVETLEKRRLTTSAECCFDGTPAFSPDGRALAFTRWRGDRSDLYLLRLGMDYQRQGEQQVSPSGEEPYVYAADWIPHGSEIVFSRGLFFHGGPASLWRISSGGSARARRLAIAPERVTGLSISRGGNRLAYTVPNWKSSIWRVDVRVPSQTPTAPFQLIRSTRNQEYPTYSPDGKRVAFDSDISGHAEIWVCNSDGSNAVQLTSFGSHPKWSPDGGSIAFTSQFAVYIVGANGGSPRRLGIEEPADPWPSWSLNRQWIYFRSMRSGSEIWKMPATGGDAVQITRNGGDLPQESPDAKFIYYMNGWPEQQCSVWKIPAGGGEETMVVDSIACINYAVGKQGIYFFTPPHGQGRSNINLHDFATGKTRKILTIEQQPLSITVSPDGRTILYTQRDQAGSDLMLVENFR